MATPPASRIFIPQYMRHFQCKFFQYFIFHSIIASISIMATTPVLCHRSDDTQSSRQSPRRRAERPSCARPIVAPRSPLRAHVRRAHWPTTESRRARTREHHAPPRCAPRIAFWFCFRRALFQFDFGVFERSAQLRARLNSPNSSKNRPQRVASNRAALQARRRCLWSARVRQSAPPTHLKRRPSEQKSALIATKKT